MRDLCPGHELMRHHSASMKFVSLQLLLICSAGQCLLLPVYTGTHKMHVHQRLPSPAGLCMHVSICEACKTRIAAALSLLLCASDAKQVNYDEDSICSWLHCCCAAQSDLQLQSGNAQAN